MAKRTIEKEFFGSVAMGNPESAFTEHTFAVSYDFAKKAVPKGKTIPMIAIPKGFFITSIAVVQTKNTNNNVAVTFGLASDAAKSVGGSVTLSATTPVRSASTANPQFCSDADCLCMIMPSTIADGVDAITEGAVDICVRGFEAFCEGKAGLYEGLDEQYRQDLQTPEMKDMNISGGQFPND